LSGVGEEAAAAAGELPLAGGVAARALDVAALDVALPLTSAVVGGVGEPTMVALVDVAAGVDEATVSTGDVNAVPESVDVAAT